MVQLIVGSRCQTEVENAEQDSGIRPTADEDNVLFVAQSWPTLWDPMDCSPPGSPGKNTGVGGQGNPGIKPRSPVLQADSLLPEPPGKPNNSGVGSLSLFPGNFPTRNQIGVSQMAGGFFTSWATQEAQIRQ